MGKMVALGHDWFNLGKGGCICAIMVPLGQRWLYLGKGSSIRAKCLYWAKVVVFRQR